eukprot:403348708
MKNMQQKDRSLKDDQNTLSGTSMKDNQQQLSSPSLINRDSLNNNLNTVQSDQRDGGSNQKDQQNQQSKEQMLTMQEGNMGTKVALLQQYGDNYAQMIKIEQVKINEITNKIKDVQVNIEKSRKMIRDSHGQRESSEHVQKKIKSLENRLDKQLQKFNSAVAFNRQLRQEIDSMRQEKVVFDNIYAKLQSELAKKKDKLMKIIRRAENAFQQKEQAIGELQQLKRDSERQQEEFDRECEKLNQLIQKDRQIRDYIKTKEENKAQQLTTANALKSTMSVISQGSILDGQRTQRQDNLNELTNTEKSLKKQVSQLGWSIARDTANVHLSMAKMQQYEEAFNSIKIGTNLNNIDQLVSEFVDAENLNFSLYNYVKDLTHEMDDLEAEIMSIKQEIEKFRGHGVNNEKNRDNIVSSLTKELLQTEEELKSIELDYMHTMKTINALKVGIQSIFNKIKVSTDDIPELTGSKQVSESNMLQYLSYIERVTDETLYQFQQKQAKEGYEQNNNNNENNGGSGQQNKNTGTAGANGKSVGNKGKDDKGLSQQMEPPDLMNWSDYENDEQYAEDLAVMNPVKLHQKYRERLAKEGYEQITKKLGGTIGSGANSVINSQGGGGTTAKMSSSKFNEMLSRKQQ